MLVLSPYRHSFESLIVFASEANPKTKLNSMKTSHLNDSSMSALLTEFVTCTLDQLSQLNQFVGGHFINSKMSVTWVAWQEKHRGSYTYALDVVFEVWEKQGQTYWPLEAHCSLMFLFYLIVTFKFIENIETHFISECLGFCCETGN